MLDPHDPGASKDKPFKKGVYMTKWEQYLISS